MGATQATMSTAAIQSAAVGTQRIFTLNEAGRYEAGDRSRASNNALLSSEIRTSSVYKNPVNLKKDSLNFVPTSDSHKFNVTFVVDAITDYQITLYYTVIEKTENNIPVLYPVDETSKVFTYTEKAGLNKTFITPPDATFNMFDFRQSSLKELNRPDGSVLYGLAVRLVALNAPPDSQGNPAPFQAQFSFASVVIKRDNNQSTPQLEVCARKVVLGQNCFVERELFGMSAAQSAEDDNGCVVCYGEKDTAILPCRHMCLCHDCAAELRGKTANCPICRGPISSMLRIDAAQKKEAAELAKASSYKPPTTT